jgi:hypothetical protein
MPLTVKAYFWAFFYNPVQRISLNDLLISFYFYNGRFVLRNYRPYESIIFMGFNFSSFILSILKEFALIFLPEKIAFSSGDSC